MQGSCLPGEQLSICRLAPSHCGRYGGRPAPACPALAAGCHHRKTGVVVAVEAPQPLQAGKGGGGAQAGGQHVGISISIVLREATVDSLQ